MRQMLYQYINDKYIYMTRIYMTNVVSMYGFVNKLSGLFPHVSIKETTLVVQKNW